MSLDALSHIVIDEADLVLSYGYEEDLQILARTIPEEAQLFLMSATLATELETLKSLFSRSPVVLELDDAADEAEGISQFVVKYVRKLSTAGSSN